MESFESFEGEVWKEFCEGVYLSNFGRCIKEYYGESLSPKIINPKPNSGGYLRIHTNNKFYYIHRLVALCFIKNPQNKKFIDHKDINPINNHIDNLRWVTHRENNFNKKSQKNSSTPYTNISKTKYGYQLSIIRNKKVLFSKHSKDLKYLIKLRNEKRKEFNFPPARDDV